VLRVSPLVKRSIIARRKRRCTAAYVMKPAPLG
jgi:hypothetical protein